MTNENLLESAYSSLLHAAEYIVTEGIAHARQDDPHRFATIAAGFDGGKAARQLTITYLAGKEVEVQMRLLGRQGGEIKEVSLFTTTLAPAAMPTEH